MDTYLWCYELQVLLIAIGQQQVRLIQDQHLQVLLQGGG